MGMLILETIGPRAEELADKAAEAVDAAAGFDPDFNCVTFDSDDLENDALEAAVVQALGGIDSDWQSQLRVAE
jgi:hypothetical protein